MNNFSLDKCSLIREIKKYQIAGKKNAGSQIQRFQSKLGAIIPDNNFKLLPFEDMVYVKFRMLHDAKNAVGYSQKTEKMLTLTSGDLTLLLKSMQKAYGDEVVLIYSNYPKETPFVLTTFGYFADSYCDFFDLLEDDMSILSEDLGSYLAINSEDFVSADKVAMKSIGAKFGSLLNTY
jgi:hypothetical protein